MMIRLKNLCRRSFHLYLLHLRLKIFRKFFNIEKYYIHIELINMLNETNIWYIWIFNNRRIFSFLFFHFDNTFSVYFLQLSVKHVILRRNTVVLYKCVQKQHSATDVNARKVSVTPKTTFALVSHLCYYFSSTSKFQYLQPIFSKTFIIYMFSF